MLRFMIVFFLINIVTACSLGGTAPVDHFYRLPEIILKSQDNPQFKNIVIKPVKSSGLYHERAILYIEADKPLELQRYHYNFWTTPPASIVHDALYQGLTSSGLSSNISRELSSNRPDYIIDTRILKFERLIEGKQVKAIVALDVSIRRGSGGESWSRRYQASQVLDTMDMHQSAEAFGDVMQTITEQLRDDLLFKK